MPWQTFCICISQDEKSIDPFVIYNPTYSTLREAVYAAAFENTYDELNETMEVSFLSE